MKKDKNMGTNRREFLKTIGGIIAGGLGAERLSGQAPQKNKERTRKKTSKEEDLAEFKQQSESFEQLRTRITERDNNEIQLFEEYKKQSDKKGQDEIDRKLNNNAWNLNGDMARLRFLSLRGELDSGENEYVTNYFQTEAARVFTEFFSKFISRRKQILKEIGIDLTVGRPYIARPRDDVP